MSPFQYYAPPMPEPPNIVSAAEVERINAALTECREARSHDWDDPTAVETVCQRCGTRRTWTAS